MMEDLIEGLLEQLRSRGVLADKAALTEAVLAALQGPAQEMSVGKDKVTVTASFSAFGMATPTGSCGSLPTSIVVRFSGGTGTAANLNGKSATLTYSTLSQTWTGSFGTGLQTENVTLACVAGHWALTLAGGQGMGTGQVTGTSGTTPNLTGTLTISGANSGTILCTITRT